jgi:hypothetical protein
MSKVTVIATHCWADGAKTQFVIKGKAYPDSLETLEDIATRCGTTFLDNMRELLEIAYPADIQAD